MRFIVSDEDGELRRFRWKDEAERFMKGQTDLTLTVLPKEKKKPVDLLALVGEALI